MTDKEHMLQLADFLDAAPRHELPYSPSIFVTVTFADKKLRDIAAELRRRAQSETVETSISPT